jgi:IS4 transposase
VTKLIQDKTKKFKARGVLKEQYITMGVKQNGIVAERLKLRRTEYTSEDIKHYALITNNFTLQAKQIAAICKNRWMIVLLFKQITLNFPLRYFWGESPNAIKMQVYWVLMAQLLMVIIRKKAATKKSFANMITVIRLHLMSYVGLLEFINDTYKAWRKMNDLPLAFSP